MNNKQITEKVLKKMKEDIRISNFDYPIKEIVEKAITLTLKEKDAENKKRTLIFRGTTGDIRKMAEEQGMFQEERDKQNTEIKKAIDEFEKIVWKVGFTTNSKLTRAVRECISEMIQEELRQKLGVGG